jgi:hypothetical protein
LDEDHLMIRLIHKVKQIVSIVAFILIEVITPSNHIAG